MQAGRAIAACVPRLPEIAAFRNQIVQSMESAVGTAVEVDAAEDECFVRCIGGDMLACDLVANASPVGSELERIGRNCGDRIAVVALPDCRTRFPT